MMPLVAMTIIMLMIDATSDTTFTTADYNIHVDDTNAISIPTTLVVIVMIMLMTVLS